jgi:hypothetical protein
MPEALAWKEDLEGLPDSNKYRKLETVSDIYRRKLETVIDVANEVGLSRAR